MDHETLRLAGISDLASAIQFLARTFLPAFNRRVNVVAASPTDRHQAVPQELAEVLSWEAERAVQRDWTVAHGGRWYQVDRRHEGLSLAGRRVIVRILRDGRVQLVYREAKLRWQVLLARREGAGAGRSPAFTHSGNDATPARARLFPGWHPGWRLRRNPLGWWTETPVAFPELRMARTPSYPCRVNGLENTCCLLEERTARIAVMTSVLTWHIRKLTHLR